MPAAKLKQTRYMKERVAAYAEPPEVIGNSTLINGAHSSHLTALLPGAGTGSHCPVTAARVCGARRPALLAATAYGHLVLDATDCCDNCRGCWVSWRRSTA